MMPKTLNVEKLEKKFASLTRSRESIQGLSSWIMHHKEFCKEIVQEWLSGLTKDFNTLTMFYVANDVIQNCGRKKATEFRDAFSTALEKAVCLEKVREIKSDVSRLLKIWNEREIYADEYFKRLENRLNGIGDEQTSESEEVSESEIIRNFQVNNLINCLQNLRSLEDLLQKKEVILKDWEEPVMPNMENLIVKMESHSEIKKLNEYYDYVEEYISLASSVEDARKTLLKELKYSSVYYSVQNEDVKKVAHAYRIYGKKLKNMEKLLLEKICDLERKFPSPVHSDSPDDHGADLIVSQKSSGGDTFSPELQHVTVEDKTGGSHDCAKETKQNTEKRTDSSKNISSIKSTEEINNYNEEKNGSVTVQSSENLTGIDPLKNESSDITKNELIAKNSASVKDTADGYSNEVDFLLEEAFDIRPIKSKLSIKRKIESLLNAKSKKACHSSPENDKTNQPIPNSDHLASSPVNNLDSLLLATKNSEPEISLEVGQKLVTAVEKSSEISEISSKEQLEDKLNNKTDDLDKSVSLDAVEKDDQSINTTGKKPRRPSLHQILSDVITSGKTVDTDSTSYNQLPEIPTELLESILQKNKINMTYNAQNYLDNEGSSRVPNKLTTSTRISGENFPLLVDPTDQQKNINSTEDSKSNISENKLCSPNDCSNEDIKIPCLGDEILPEFCKDMNGISESSASIPFDANQNKETLDCKGMVPSATTEKSSSQMEERPSLIETLQNVLKLISGNEASKNQAVKDRISHNPPTLMPLENTLKLYQYMMQYYGKTSDEQKLLSNELKPNESSKINLLSIQNNSVTEHSSTHLQIKTANESCMPVCGNKEDNLEIMDMDVDSGDENMDS